MVMIEEGHAVEETVDMLAVKQHNLLPVADFHLEATHQGAVFRVTPSFVDKDRTEPKGHDSNTPFHVSFWLIHNLLHLLCSSFCPS